MRAFRVALANVYLDGKPIAIGTALVAPSHAAALVEAREVLAYKTRSHVGAARILAKALLAATAELEEERDYSLALLACLNRIDPSRAASG